jgi:Rieske Fe-S protein
MSQTKKPVGRRSFLVGLLTGAGAAGALAAAPRKATAKKEPAEAEVATGPILYRRTEDVERYYRTLYR